MCSMKNKICIMPIPEDDPSRAIPNSRKSSVPMSASVASKSQMTEALICHSNKGLFKGNFTVLMLKLYFKIDSYLLCLRLEVFHVVSDYTLITWATTSFAFVYREMFSQCPEKYPLSIISQKKKQQPDLNIIISSKHAWPKLMSFSGLRCSRYKVLLHMLVLT